MKRKIVCDQWVWPARDAARNAMKLDFSSITSAKVGFRVVSSPGMAELRSAATSQQGDIQQSQRALRAMVVKIGAKVVSHGRYVTFQLAEVAVPRSLFQKILDLIQDLRRRPAPA